jgi:phosphonate transport system substrate-binding protein
VKLIVPNDLEELTNSLDGGGIDFALQDPHTYVQLSRFFNKSEILQTLNPEGGSTQSGVVVVRSDSGLNGLQDLKNKTVLFGPKTSNAKWIAARILFENAGIQIDRDLQSYRFGGCCEDIAFSVSVKSVDAGVICDHFMADHEEKQKDLGVDKARLKIIARTDPFPTRIFAASIRTSPDMVEKMKQALLRLDRKNPEHAKILLRGEMGGFKPVLDHEYDSIRKAMAAKYHN